MCYNIKNANGRRMTMFCTHCGKENPNDAKFCNACGKSFSKDTKPNNVQKFAPTQSATEPTANMAIVSLVFGICSIPTAFLAIWFSLLCAITSIVLGKISLDQKRPGKDYAKWGLQLGAIGLGISVAFIIIYFVSIFGALAFISDLIPSLSR